MDEIVWSIKNGDLDQVAETFEKERNKVNTELQGRYPLHFAADYGQCDVLEYLINIGADVNVCNLQDKHGISPLLAAIWEGHTKCVKLLLEKGASKNGITPDGKTYLEAAEKEEIRNMLS